MSAQPNTNNAAQVREKMGSRGMTLPQFTVNKKKYGFNMTL
jgi:hypothetical protein